MEWGSERTFVPGRQILPRLRAGTETELVRTTQGHLHDYSVQVPPGPHVLPRFSHQRAARCCKLVHRLAA